MAAFGLHTQLSRPLQRAFCSPQTSLTHKRNTASLRARFACRCEGRSNLLRSTLGSTQFRVTSKKVLKQLSSLELAIGELAAIAGLSVVGTLIKQNEAAEYYVQHYPEGSPLEFRLIWALQWDQIYTANYFLALLALLAASLAACSVTRQWPMVRVARRWRLAASWDRVAAAGSPENAVTLPDADVGDFGRVLRRRGYAVFLKDGSLYAFKGLAGRLAPIGVHVSMLLIIAGVTVSVLGGLHGSVTVPEDGDFVLADGLQTRAALARPSRALASTSLHVDKFEVNYRPDGSIAQFTSKVSLADTRTGRSLERKTITVNDPLRYQGFTAYQTDWGIAAVTLRVAGTAAEISEAIPFNLPVASLDGQPGVSGKLWATFMPAESPRAPDATPRGVSLVMKDTQTVVLYDSSGQFIGVRRPGSGKAIEVEGLQIIVDGLVGSTGLELKVDPGVPYVYAGFGGLMLTTAISYLSHSQIWALQDRNLLHVNGKTNRAKVEFESELAALVDQVPERA